MPSPMMLLGGAVGVLLLVVAGLGLLLKHSYAANGALETKLAGAQAVIDQREKDAKANAIAVAQLAQKLSDTETKVITVTERIYAAPVTRDCVKSPAIGAALGGLQQLYLTPAIQAPGGREPAAAVQGSRAPAK